MDTSIRLMLILIGFLLLLAIIWDVVKKRKQNNNVASNEKSTTTAEPRKAPVFRTNPNINLEQQSNSVIDDLDAVAINSVSNAQTERTDTTDIQEDYLDEDEIWGSNSDNASSSINNSSTASNVSSKNSNTNSNSANIANNTNGKNTIIIKDDSLDSITTINTNFDDSFSDYNLEQNEPRANNNANKNTSNSNKDATDINHPIPKSISISIVASEVTGFNGNKLKNALDAVYLFHGKMNIFHRFKFNNGSGNLLFSVASATEPGTFDLNTMANKSFSGITLFFIVDHVAEPENSLDSMLKTAKQLAFRLNGHLLDQYHKPLTINQIEDYKDSLKTIVN